MKERLITCPICGTLYDSDSPEDRNAHNSICSLFHDGVKWISLALEVSSCLMNQIRA